jgi:hypothetical protein
MTQGLTPHCFIVQLCGTDLFASFGWAEAGLERLAKGHPVKVQIANHLRTQTTMTWTWIAAHLKMAAPGYAANLCRNQRQPAIVRH